ncbi:hypothetical protein CIPAW_13G052700 [Carya illinoinensis]|uniref:Uncharacterized protein n=1 Tax=Carya illinoinensis TaxID=32201 RepID=A0A8T1NKM8_CARIL|nr:hypothetical protein CIPAW_13G052700 [Carya illinoinensis]
MKHCTLGFASDRQLSSSLQPCLGEFEQTKAGCKRQSRYNGVRIEHGSAHGNNHSSRHSCS